MKPALLYSCLLLLSACSAERQVQIKDENGQIVEEYQITKKTGKKNGEYRRLSEGKVIEVAYYLNDTLDGLRILYNSEGAKEIEENYIKGVYQGAYLSYYPDGQIKIEGIYQQGTMEGIWKKYYDSGKLMESVTMHDNQENGSFIEYWENGNLKAEGTYLDGDNEEGELKLYDESGTLEKTMQCQQGVCHTTWKRETSAGQ